MPRRGGGREGVKAIKNQLTRQKTYKTYNHAVSNIKNEDYYNDLFCAELGGERETKHYYKYGTKRSFVKVDCETTDYVYEGGRDTRSSLDSVQQAKFFSILTGKKPAIVIYNTDGKFGKYEHRIKQVAKSWGVKFILKKP